MTTLIFTLRGLDGGVIPNTKFKIIAGYPDDTFDPGLEIPSSQEFTTDGLGQATVELTAINLPYYVSKATNSIDDYVAFKLYVPESAVPLSAEFLYVDLGTHLHTLSDKSMYTFIEAKVAVFNAVEQTATLAAGAGASASAASASASAASVSAAAALVSENAAEAAAAAAEAAAENVSRSVDTIASLKLITGSGILTTVINVAGYYATGDGGGGQFWWDSASTATDNGGTIIQATGVVTGRWKRIYSGDINAAWFGLVSDGTTDNYTALAAASLLAMGGALHIPAGNYWIGNTLSVYSKTTYYGDGENNTIITQNSVNAPILASTGYLTGASPTGNCVIRDMRIIGGTSAGAGNHGIVLRDYYSTIEGLRVINTGGDSIHVTTRTSGGVEVGGTLVENRIINVNLTDPAGYGIYAGEYDNNKLTDGFIQNVTINASATTTDGIFIGSSAGWILDGIHVYGTPLQNGIRIANAFHTNASNIYIESFTLSGLYAPRTQRALALANINIKTEVAGAPAVRIDKSSGVTSASVSITNLVVVNTSAAAVYGIKTDSSEVYVNLGSHVMENKGSGSITLLDMSNKERCLRVTDAVVDGSMRDGANLAGLVYGGTMIQSFSANKRIEAVNPAVEITETIAIGPIYSYRAMAGLLTIKLRSNYNGTVRATYCGMIHIQAKLNGSDSWVVSLDQIIAAAGLTTGPTATIVDNGDGTGTLTVKFTPTDTDAYGALTLNLSASENA